VSTLVDLGVLAEGGGLGTVGETIFLGSAPPSPDAILTIFQYPGGSTEYVQESPRPSQVGALIQIVGRGHDYVAVETLVDNAWRLFTSVVNSLINGTKYRKIWPNGMPGLIGRDNNDRVMIGFNATAEREI
jgi:hypothetical protein